MSPIVKNKGEKFTIEGKYLLFILTLLCCLLLIITYKTSFIGNFLNNAIGTVLIPFEKGISNAGVYLNTRGEQLKQINDLLAENEALKKEVDRLTVENTQMQQDRYELMTLRELYELDNSYEDYDKTGAHVIARDSGNWFHFFVIDKGTDDGLTVDMNVMAGAGLVGRIVDVGHNWAKVKSVIADDSNVSAMVLTTQDNMIVSGNLKLYEEGKVSFSQLLDRNDQVNVGDKVVTSNISDKFLPGILIGYISEINVDANNLTKSGTITPAVDFEHIEEVLVVLDKKQSLPEEENQ